PQLDADGEITQIVFTVEDISIQKEWEDNLRRLLNREVELSQLKSNFLSMVSHEFRTPLSVILTSTTILHSYQDRLSEEQRAKRLDMIEKQVERLKRMLDSVSSLNKAQFVQRPLTLTRIRPNEYLTSVIREIEMAYDPAPEVFYKVTSEVDSVVTDEMYFHQILSNLISNAVKYTPPDKTVSVTLTCTTSETSITVQDKGIGIPMGEQMQMFSVFTRASNVGNVPGTGMGLVILKQSVELLGGTVTFESTEHIGTTFRVQLPAQLPETGPLNAGS
ncbi:MAG: HAMP domain-containing sensor histidine kinase, partial [Chloroflexota bacterium]